MSSRTIEDIASLTVAERRRAKELHAFADEVRGKFLTGTAWVETLLSDVLARYFCMSERRRLLFFSDVASKMDLRHKSELLMTLLRQDFPGLIAEHPQLERLLKSVRSFRNRVAHAHIDTSKSALHTRGDHVTFIFYRKGRTHRQKVSRAGAQQRAEEANRLRNALIAIQRRVATES
jgi:hypothetical protein